MSWTLAPSRAARTAMARPTPRLPPVMNSVLPASPSAIRASSRGFVRVSDGTRTRDRLDHNQELYQLSYAHHGACGPHVTGRFGAAAERRWSRRGRARPGAGPAAPAPRSHPELAGDAAGAAPTAAEHADQLTGVEAEALEDARVLVRVDLVGQFAVGLLGLVVLAARPQQLEDLFLGYLHGSCVPAAALGNPATVDSLTW